MMRRRRGRRSEPRELRPNMLSVELVPNRLSIFKGTRPVTRPAQRAREAVQAPSTAQRPRSGLSFSTLIAGGIFALVVLSQIIGALSGEGAAPSAAPWQVATPTLEGQAESVQPGSVEFGSALREGCTLLDQASVFGVGSEVWWAARFSSLLGPDERVRWQVTRGDAVLAQDTGPTDRPTGRWDGICGNEPLRYSAAGLYHLEVWDAARGVPIAVGEFELR